MNTQHHTKILSGDFVKTLGDYELDMSESTFQQDNDPKRTSHIARKWLETNSVEVLEWSVQSPDLNPIEYLWQHLKKKLTGRETVSRSIREL